MYQEDKTIASEFVKWVENNIEEGLTCFSFPESHRKKIRTVNGLERLNKEIRRRTRVAMRILTNLTPIPIDSDQLIPIHPMPAPALRDHHRHTR